MSDSSAARHAAPDFAPKSQGFAERDTLEAIDQDFLRDQLVALLASPTLSRVADRHSEGRDDPAEFDAERDVGDEWDTEPNVDARLVREALEAGLKGK